MPNFRALKKHAQVWLYFIRRTTLAGKCEHRPRILRLFWIPQNIATKINQLFPYFPTRKIHESKISIPKKIECTSKGIVAAQDQYKPCSKLVQEIDIKKYKIEEKWQCD